MKNFFIYLSYLTVALTSCSSNRNPTNIQKKSFTNSKAFFKSFESNLSGKSKILFYVTRDSASIDGDSILHFIFDGLDKNEPLQELVGKITPNGAFELSYFNDTATIKLKGIFLNDSIVNLDLNNLEGMKRGTIEFRETKNRNLTIAPLTFYKSKLDIGPDKNFIGEVGDTCLSYININAFKFNGTEANNIINLVDSSLPFVSKNGLENFFRDYDPSWGYDNVRISVAYFDDHRLTLMISHEENAYGATHPQHNINYLNYSLLDSKTIKLSDIFPDSAIAQVENICKQIFITNHKNSEDTSVFPYFEDFHLPKTFGLLRMGVLFQFLPYEMGSFAEGAITTFIPYSQIRGLMKNNTITKNLTRVNL